MDEKMHLLAIKVRLEMLKNGVSSTPENIEELCSVIAAEFTARGAKLSPSFKNELMMAVMALSV